MRTGPSRALKAGVLTALAATVASPHANAADFGLYAEAGTFGVGGGLAVQLGERFSIRAGYSAFSHDIDDYDAQDLTLDADLTLGAGKLLVDWYPTGGGFRMSAGVMLNRTDGSAVARPAAGGYTINGHFYSSSEVGTANGEVDFDSAAQFVGIGFGRALDKSGRVNVLLDLGAAFTGAPDVALTATCGAVSAAVCAQIQADIAVERAEVESDANDLKVWPYVNFAVSWRF